jgi:Zn-dependent protease
MFRSWRIGSAFGVPIKIHSTFLLIPLLVVMQHGFGSWFRVGFLVAAVLAVFFCVLLHEFGHVLMARYFGIRTRDVTLYPLGGVARLENLTEEPHQELLIAIAGPAVNVVIAMLLTPFFIAAVATKALTLPDPTNVAADDGTWSVISNFVFLVWLSNITLVLFNLIPAFPMDGGRVLRAMLASGMDFVKATEVAVWVGMAVSGVLALLAVFFLHNFMMVIVVGFAVLAGQMELQAIRRREEMRRIRREYGSVGFFDDPRGRDTFRRPVEVFPPRTAEPRPGPRPVSAPTPPKLVYFLRAVEIPDPPRN